MTLRSLHGLELLLGGGVIVAAMAAVIQAKTWDLGPGMVTVLQIAIPSSIGLAGAIVTAYFARKSSIDSAEAKRLGEKTHDAVNSTASILKLQADKDKGELVESRQEASDLKVKVAELLSVITAANELAIVKAKAVQVAAGVEKDREIADLKAHQPKA